MISFSRAWSRRIAFTGSSLSAEVRDARRLIPSLRQSGSCHGPRTGRKTREGRRLRKKRRPFRCPPSLYPRLGRRPAIANRSPRDGPQDPGEPAPRTRALPSLRQPLDDAGDRLESGIRFGAASCLVEMDTPPGWRGVGMRFLSTGPMQESGRIRPNTMPEAGFVVNLLVSLEHAAQYGERSVSGRPAGIRVLRKPRHDGTHEWLAGRQRPEAIQRALCRNGTSMFEAPERHAGRRSAGKAAPVPTASSPVRARP